LPRAPETVLSIAQTLIRCPSVTPEDGGALDYVAGLLKEAGFKVERPAFSEPGQPVIQNLFARIGQGSPCLAFAGHTDVVPPGNEADWSRPPFAGQVVDGRLYGRGAVDMKGGIAAMLAAVLAHLEQQGAPEHGSIAILLTGDEEGPAISGTVKLLAWAAERGERLDHCVLGEPTNPDRIGEMIKIGRRGSLTGRLRIRGRQGHVAYPHLAQNPIPVLGRVIAALHDPPLDRGTNRFDPSNLEFTTVDVGNPATNVVPAAAEAVFNIRFNDVWTPDTLAAEIRLRTELACGPEVAIDLRFDPTNAIAFLTEPDSFVDLVRDAAEAETGLRPQLSTTGGTSDARFICRYCPVIEFGLVGQTMHAIDENVATEDLETLTRIYGRVIEAYLPRTSLS
jgi:succinyl-diaminopimelate desuccinylase